jgi:hypothetical protein
MEVAPGPDLGSRLIIPGYTGSLSETPNGQSARWPPRFRLGRAPATLSLPGPRPPSLGNDRLRRNYGPFRFSLTSRPRHRCRGWRMIGVGMWTTLVFTRTHPNYALRRRGRPIPGRASTPARGRGNRSYRSEVSLRHRRHSTSSPTTRRAFQFALCPARTRVEITVHVIAGRAGSARLARWRMNAAGFHTSRRSVEERVPGGPSWAGGSTSASHDRGEAECFIAQPRWWFFRG